MGHCPAIVLILGCFLVQESVNAFAQTEEPRHAQISRHIRDLGSDSFLEREQAHQQLIKIGSPAVSALKQASITSDLEVRWRLSQLLSLLIPQVFYTISQDGRLFRLTVRQQDFQCQQIANLGSPFDQPNGSVEGLAMSSQGVLYASVVFREGHQEYTLELHKSG